MQQKGRLAGNHKQCDALHLHIISGRSLFHWGEKKNSSLRYFQSGAQKERLESIINKHLMFTNPKLGIFLWLVDSLYLRTISWRDWKQKTNRFFWRTRGNCASRCFQKRCTKFIERVVGIRNGGKHKKGDFSKSKFKIFLWFVILCTVVP